MRFCTVVTCMDGRIQLPVIQYLQKRFYAQYVDSITEAGPKLILSQQKPINSVRAILDKLRISIENHNSEAVAVVGHHDCAGNPRAEKDLIVHIQDAIRFLQQHYPDLDMTGLWLDSNWDVNEVGLVESGGHKPS